MTTLGTFRREARAIENLARQDDRAWGRGAGSPTQNPRALRRQADLAAIAEAGGAPAIGDLEATIVGYFGFTSGNSGP
jgi:hypothetical protein